MHSSTGVYRSASFLAVLCCCLVAGAAAAKDPLVRSKWKPLQVLESSNFVTQVAFSPDSKLLAVANYPNQAVTEHNVGLWDVETGANRANFHGDYRAAFSPDGKFLATAVPGGAELWMLATGVMQAEFEGHENAVNGVVVSSDGKQIATCSRDRTVRLWEAQSGKPIAVLREHTNIILSVTFAADRKTLVSASFDGTARLWDLATLKDRQIPIHSRAPGCVRCLAISPDSAIVATGSTDGTIKLWRAATGQELAAWPGHTGTIYSLAFAPNGRSILSGGGDPSGNGDHTARLWDLSSNKVIAEFDDHEDQVFCVAFIPDGTMLATGSHDKTARIYKLADRKP